MNVLFCDGDNWYPAIIGSKAVGVFHNHNPLTLDSDLNSLDQ